MVDMGISTMKEEDDQLIVQILYDIARQVLGNPEGEVPDKSRKVRDALLSIHRMEASSAMSFLNDFLKYCHLFEPDWTEQKEEEEKKDEQQEKQDDQKDDEKEKKFLSKCIIWLKKEGENEKQQEKVQGDESWGKYKQKLRCKNFKESKFTVLHVAALLNKEEIVHRLLHLTDLEARSLLAALPPDAPRDSESPYFYRDLLLQSKTRQGWTALHLCACAEKSSGVVATLLMEAYRKMTERMKISEKIRWKYIIADLFRDEREMTPLHYAVWTSNIEVVRQFLDGDKTGTITNLRAVDMFLLTPLHVTAMQAEGDVEVELLNPKIAELLLRHLGYLAKYQDDITAKKAFEELEKDCVNAPDCCSYTPLHWAAHNKADMIMRLLLENRSIAPLELDDEGHSPLHLAGKQAEGKSSKECLALLLGCDQVKQANKILMSFRQGQVDSANAILVGASLIASITFGAYLQPPLGLVTYYEYGAYHNSPPTDYKSYAAVEKDSNVEVFWIVNCLSFLTAIATVLISSLTVATSSQWQPNELMADVVNRNGKLVRYAYSFLLQSVLFALGSFVTVGLSTLPPPLKVRLLDFVVPGSLIFLVCTVISLGLLVVNSPKFGQFLPWRKADLQELSRDWFSRIHHWGKRMKSPADSKLVDLRATEEWREVLKSISGSNWRRSTEIRMGSGEFRRLKRDIHADSSVPQCRLKAVREGREASQAMSSLIGRYGMEPWYL